MSEDDVIYEIVAALAAAEEVPLTELEYDLGDYINPEALVNLFAVDNGAWEFTFQVPGHELTVTHAGEIFIDGALFGSVRDSPEDGDGHTDPTIEENIQYRQTLLHNVPCMLYRRENQRGWPMEFVSGTAKAITGYDPNAFVIGGVSYGEDVIHPDDRQRVRETVEESLSEEEQYSQTYRIQTTENGEKRVWDKGVGVFSDGEAVALVGCVTSLSTSEAEIPQSVP